MTALLPIDPDNQPMGANVVADGTGVVFRCWAPRASRVWVRGSFNGWLKSDAGELNRRGDYFSGFIPGVKDGDEYKFHVEGAIGGQDKRDPYARELGVNPAYPVCNCIVRDPRSFVWSDQSFRTPPLNDLILYQLHVGTFNGPDRQRRPAKFLDVLGKLDFLSRLGVNAVQLLPIVEFASPRSLGYEGSDIFSPEMDYCVPTAELPNYLPLVNGLRNRTGLPSLTVSDLGPHGNQLKVMIDLFHRWGIAVIFDVVYNHVGGQIKGQAESFWNFEQAKLQSDDDSSYNTSRDHTGPCFALWKAPVRQFLIDNAKFFLREYHVDGFRYDQVSAIVSENTSSGWLFCQNITGTLHAERPESAQIAEYWNVDPYVVRFTEHGGAGFDATLHDALRTAVRDAVSATVGSAGPVDLGRIASALWPAGFLNAWRSVQYLESHDEVKFGANQRVARLGDPNEPRSWWARSRARVANGLLLTAPGIPMLFMGQDFAEDKQWDDNAEFRPGNLIWWDGIDWGREPVQQRFRTFMEQLVWLRRNEPALRGETLNVLHQNANGRVLAFHRWLEGSGQDIVVVASLNHFTFDRYDLPWPAPGYWREIFNSEAYDDYHPSGNAGGITAFDTPRDGMPATASLTIPANSILVFRR